MSTPPEVLNCAHEERLKIGSSNDLLGRIMVRRVGEVIPAPLEYCEACGVVLMPRKTVRQAERTPGVAVGPFFVALLLALFLAGCESPTAADARMKREAWVEPCRDESVLLATTAGSPNSHECPNRLHKMRVQVATSPSNEEAAALVFCECQTPQTGVAR